MGDQRVLVAREHVGQDFAFVGCGVGSAQAMGRPPGAHSSSGRSRISGSDGRTTHRAPPRAVTALRTPLPGPPLPPPGPRAPAAADPGPHAAGAHPSCPGRSPASTATGLPPATSPSGLTSPGRRAGPRPARSVRGTERERGAGDTAGAGLSGGQRAAGRRVRRRRAAPDEACRRQGPAGGRAAAASTRLRTRSARPLCGSCREWARQPDRESGPCPRCGRTLPPRTDSAGSATWCRTDTSETARRSSNSASEPTWATASARSSPATTARAAA